MARREENYSSWIRSHWRPMMAVMYMGVCFFDFVVAPIGWSWLQLHVYLINLAHTKPDVAITPAIITEWEPLTLKFNAFFHIAMGAVLGVSAYGRSQEKVSEINANANTGTEEKTE